jgi:hypothetical protein
MRALRILAIRLLVIFVKLLRSGGVRAVAAEQSRGCSSIRCLSLIARDAVPRI